MTKPAVPRCGCLLSDEGSATDSGLGCKEDFVYEGEVFRCLDCKVYMHAHCMRKHFAMSSLADLAPTVKLLKASLRKNGLDDMGEPMRVKDAIKADGVTLTHDFATS